MYVAMVMALIATAVWCAPHRLTPKNREDEDHWRKMAQDDLERALNKRYMYNEGVARNVIVAIGDGMGVSTVTAARIYDGQLRGHSGEEGYLGFEKFPHVGLIKTYTVDKQVGDSAGTAQAILSGVKTNSKMLGVNSNAKYNVCASLSGNEVDSILDWSLAAGKSVGVITNDRVTGATIAAAYAHTPNRDWHGGQQSHPPCKDIARQLVEDNPKINVVLGGGSQHFIPRHGNQGHGRIDGRDLIETWKKQKKASGANHRYVTNLDELNKVDAKDVDYLFGLFNWNRLSYASKRSSAKVPSLADMTKKAISILSKNKKGFLLIIEGALIDLAHHDNKAQLALREVLEFQEAISVATNMTDQSDTLISVTADHSHIFTISGYPLRGNPIFSLTHDDESLDGKPTTTLGYTNGPGWVGRDRPVINESDLENIDFYYTGGRPAEYESHGGEDVAIYAQGPMAHLFHGVHEQSYIAHVLAHASCVKTKREDCQQAGLSNSLMQDKHWTFIYILILMAVVVGLV